MIAKTHPDPRIKRVYSAEFARRAKHKKEVEDFLNTPVIGFDDDGKEEEAQP